MVFEEGLMYTLIIAVVAIIIIIVVYKFAMEQRDREFSEKEKILNKKHN